MALPIDVEGPIRAEVFVVALDEEAIILTGQTTDVQIQAEQIVKAKRTLNEIIARHTGQTVEQVAEDGDRDKYFDAHEAKAYGLVDEVFEPVEKAKTDNGKKP